MLSKTKVVVIDDETDICILIKSILDKTGLYEVRTANDGATGCDVCFEFKPDLVFVDYLMPKIKGDEVVKFINDRLNEFKVSVVLMSGLAESVYFSQSDQEWPWFNKDVSVKTYEGIEIQHCKWKVPPPSLENQLGIKAILSKPFHKATLLAVAEHLSAK